MTFREERDDFVECRERLVDELCLVQRRPLRPFIDSNVNSNVHNSTPQKKGESPSQLKTQKSKVNGGGNQSKREVTSLAEHLRACEVHGEELVGQYAVSVPRMVSTIYAASVLYWHMLRQYRTGTVSPSA
eukprot:1008114-Rhodomonas_salina.1